MGRTSVSIGSMPKYDASYRVLDTPLRKVYEAQGVQGVFQHFGASGLYELFNKWNTGGHWLETKRNGVKVRITAGFPIGSQLRIRDMYVLLTIHGSIHGGMVTMLDEDVDRFASILRNAPEDSIVDEWVGDVRVSKGIDDPDYRLYYSPDVVRIMFRNYRGDFAQVGLAEDEVHEVEGSLPHAVAEVEFYRSQKGLAEALLGERE